VENEWLHSRQWREPIREWRKQLRFASPLGRRERDSRNKAEEFPAPPIGKLLGMTITKIGNGQDSVELQADERHANPMGTIHGGVFWDIADAVMGLAYRSTLAESESLTTIELKINFLRPVKFLT
jgi:acyl-coenzyme A thioesterase PaaI-like protein